ncbi:putative phage abortive infection protein [Leisingera sp. D0M16]|uniref:putative phage abortive infection protein n=1 Tax=Leisingera coralii TaxID=3351347 RepID=UPI003B7F7031
MAAPWLSRRRFRALIADSEGRCRELLQLLLGSIVCPSSLIEEFYMNWRRHLARLEELCAKIGRAVLNPLRKEKRKRAKGYLTVWTRRYPFEFFLAIAGLVFGFWLFNPFLMKWAAEGFANAGPVGDSFGALTSLFTGAAFVGLIATLMQQQREIRMQRQDLKMQRDEMKAARAELEGQKKQMALQNQRLQQQMFEQTFFNMLAIFNGYIDDLTGPSQNNGKAPYSGRDQLGQIYIDLLRVSFWDQDGASDLNRVAYAANEFIRRYPKHADDLNSYFRLLYNTLKFVDRQAPQNAKLYINILRAQLSDSECGLIALTCATPTGAKMKALAHKYDLLKHLPEHFDEVPLTMITEYISEMYRDGLLPEI